MTYEKILQHATCAAHQRSAGFDKAGRISIKCGDGAGQAILYLKTTGLPLCARSRADWGTGSGPGKKNSFYSQTIQGSDPNASSICKFNRQDSERNSDPGAGSLFTKRSEAWLRRGDGLEISSWNKALIDCQLKRSYKFIGSWYLIKLGKGVMKTDA
jgi:hypothetical protein